MRASFFALFAMLVGVELAAQDFQENPALQITYALGTVPEDTALGDFDGDNNLDVVFANTYFVAGQTSIDGTISVLFSNGDGTFEEGFSPTNELSIGLRTEGLATGDFNGDTYDDIAAANFDSGEVCILLSDGPSRSFDTQNSIVPHADPRHVRAAFVNNDTDIDLVTANYDDDTLSVFLGNGDGTFSLGANAINTGNGPETIALAHVNNDRKLDLIVPNALANTVGVYLGNGDGTFSLGATVDSGDDHPRYVATYDFNNDDRDDFIVSHFRGEDTIKVFRNTGNGTAFVEEFSDNGGATLNSPLFIALGDLNNDGVMDFTTGFIGSGDNTVGYFAGTGDFNFATRQDIAVNNRPYGLAINDFNNDNANDLMTVEMADDQVTFRFGVQQDSP